MDHMFTDNNTGFLTQGMVLLNPTLIAFEFFVIIINEISGE
jgi:hypothetical protein